MYELLEYTYICISMYVFNTTDVAYNLDYEHIVKLEERNVIFKFWNVGFSMVILLYV